MKGIFRTTLVIAMLFAGLTFAEAEENEKRDLAGITKALDLYADAAIKGDSKIAQPALSPGATMPHTEKGKLVTAPISGLNAYFDKTGPPPRPCARLNL